MANPFFAMFVSEPSRLSEVQNNINCMSLVVLRAEMPSISDHFFKVHSSCHCAFPLINVLVPEWCLHVPANQLRFCRKAETTGTSRSGVSPRAPRGFSAHRMAFGALRTTTWSDVSGGPGSWMVEVLNGPGGRQQKAGEHDQTQEIA